MNKVFKKALTCVMAGALCLTMAIPAFAEDTEGTETNENIVVSEDQTFEDRNITGTIYIEKDATLTMDGENIVDGTIYVFGTLCNEGTLTVTNAIYCLNYNDIMFAGNNYDYGYFINNGYVNSESLYVTDDYLGITIPATNDDSTAGSSKTEEGAGEETAGADGEEYAACYEAAYDMIALQASYGDEIDRDEIIDSLVAIGFDRELAEQVVNDILGSEDDATDNTEDEDENEEYETGLAINKTADKSTYAVGESIIYSIELSEQTEGATETDVTVTDLLPEGIHVKGVTVEGSDDAEITTSVIDIETEEDAEEISETSEDYDECMDAATELIELNNSWGNGIDYDELVSSLTALGYSDELVAEVADDIFYNIDESATDYTDFAEYTHSATVEITIEDDEYAEGNEYAFRNAVTGDAYDYELTNTEKETDEEGKITIVQTFTLYSMNEGDQNIDVYMVSGDDETLIDQTEATFVAINETETTSASATQDFVEVYIPMVDYSEPVTVTIEAYADAAGEYTNTATAISAETNDPVTSSVTITVTDKDTTGTGTGTGTDTGTGSGTTTGTDTEPDYGGKDSGTTTGGTTTTDGPKTDSSVNLAVLSAIGISACAGLAVTAISVKKKVTG